MATNGAVAASTRNFGLDLVRATAISFVLAAHSILFFLRYASPIRYARLFSLFVCLGFFGVEIFFVLSGFLIGQLIVKEVLRPPSTHGLIHFYQRRWLRTLPPYFVALMLRRLVGYPLHWRYFVFLQFFDPQVANGFPVSWSLAVEEWFYLLTPLALLAAAGSRRMFSSRRFFLVCGGIGVFALVGRTAYALLVDPPWDIGVRQHVFLRMDTLMIGVLLGGLRAYARSDYDRFARNRILLGLAGAGGFAITMALLFVEVKTRSVDGSFLMRTVYFDLVAIAVALLIVSLESSSRINKAWASSRWSGPVRFVSLTSYSLYLFHTFAFEPLLNLNSRLQSPAMAWVWMFGAWAVSLAIGGAMYRWLEKPVLRLRDRWIASVSIEQPAA
jgi:peptidoglycan/LPS O-acetylase OafA/YrhL